METTEKTKEENKAISRKFWEYFEKGEREKIENELWAKNYKLHFTGQKTLNTEESKENIMKMFNTGFPDLKITVELQVAEGDLVVDRFIANGTHKGEFRGVAPTNKNITFTGIVINRFVGSKIVERWTEVDLLGIMAQIGVSTKITQVQLEELAQ